MNTHRAAPVLSGWYCYFRSRNSKVPETEIPVGWAMRSNSWNGDSEEGGGGEKEKGGGKREDGGKGRTRKRKKKEKRWWRETRTTKLIPFEKNPAEQRQAEISQGWRVGGESKNPGAAYGAQLIPLSVASANFRSWSSGFLFSFKKPLIEEISPLSGRNQVNQISSFSI